MNRWEWITSRNFKDCIGSKNPIEIDVCKVSHPDPTLMNLVEETALWLRLLIQ
jgi:hypothetical protein